MFKNNCKHSWIARVMKLLKPVLTLRKFVMMLDFKIWKIPLYVLKYGHSHLKGKLNFINNKEITSFCKKLFVHINHHHLLNEYVFYNLFPVGNYMFKVNNRNSRKVWNMFKVNNKDTRTTPMAKSNQWNATY